MDQSHLNWIANFIWNIADDVLRDVYVRGKYRDVILPMTVLRRLDAVLREYRTRLVADVVTGQLDVRKAARHLPAEPADRPDTDDVDLEPFASEDDA